MKRMLAEPLFVKGLESAWRGELSKAQAAFATNPVAKMMLTMI